jgi:ATP dependent DNA ligase domain
MPRSAHSCLIDGEAVACGHDGLPAFDRLRYRRQDAAVFLYAFDLIELNGDDLRRDPLEVRRATLASVLTKAGPGLRFNEHMEHDDGEIVFRHACKLGLEDIVSKRKDSPYRSGRSPDWLKSKNPNAPAVKREAEEDWEKSLPKFASASISGRIPLWILLGPRPAFGRGLFLWKRRRPSALSSRPSLTNGAGSRTPSRAPSSSRRGYRFESSFGSQSALAAVI